uniref:TPR-like protein n=1 Tax=Psilocybe cubensis TaxID=181762 RepID=A0A8H7XUI3_PSICU
MVEVESIYSKCRAITPVTASRTVVENAKLAFKHWTRRNSIENEIKELKCRVSLCYIQFTMFAAARVEASTQNIRAVAKRIDATTMRIETRILKFQQHHQNFGMEANRQSPYFDPRKRDTQVADGYLRNEVDEIDQILKFILTPHTIFTITEDSHLRPFSPVLHFKPDSNKKPTYRREIISMTIDLFRLLKNLPACETSFQLGAENLLNLSIGLYHLELYQEAEVIGIWAIKLFRVLTDSNRDSYRPYLALCLHNVTHYHMAQNNAKEAHAAMVECLDISRMLVKESPTPELVASLSRSLVRSSKMATVDQKYALSLLESQNAVRVIEDFFQSTNEKHRDLSFSLFFGTGSCYLQRTLDRPNGMEIVSNESSMTQILYEYSQALHQLSHNLHHHGRFLEAIEADTKALQSIHFSGQPNTISIHADIAEILIHLCHPDLRIFIQVDDIVRYIGDAVAIYQRFADEGLIVYSRPLYHSLYIQAVIHRSVDNHTEELKTWSQAVNVARSIDDNVLCANALHQNCWSLRKLGRLDEAIKTRNEAIRIYLSVIDVPSEVLANTYYELAVDFQLADRHKEAKDAVLEALRQYRILVLQDREMYKEALADTTTLLASIFLSTHDADEALDTGEDALALYLSLPSLIHGETDAISKYLYCLDINMAAAFSSYDKWKATKRGLSLVKLFEKLTHIYPDGDPLGLVVCWRDYALLLHEHGRTEEARKWTEKAINSIESYNITAPSTIERLIICLRTHALFLDFQGLRRDALETILKAVQLANDALHVNLSLAPVYISLKVFHVDLLWESGRYDEALSVSEESVAFARRTTSLDVDSLIGCLNMHATVLNFNNHIGQSIDVANEAIELCHSYTDFLEPDIIAIHLSYAHHRLSESFADLGQHDESLSHAEVSMNKLVSFHNVIPFVRLSHFRYQLTMSSINLAERLATAGDYTKSIQLMMDARSFFEESTRSRKGYYIELTRVLRLTCLLHCSFGRHDEGAAVTIHLGSLRKRLSVFAPNIAALIDSEFERPMRRPTWLKTSDITSDCSCLPVCFLAHSEPFPMPKP